MQHFGVNVFDYFPYYKYSNDLSVMPDFDKKSKEIFDGLMNMYDLMFWYKYDGHSAIYNTIGGSLFERQTLCVVDNITSYCGLKEHVESWEEIEKIRLRYLLPNKEISMNYLNDMNLLSEVSELVADSILLQYDSEDVNISFQSINLISDNDVNDFYQNFSLDGISSSYDCRFLQSVYDYYKSYNKITIKQISVVKDILSKYKKIKRNAIVIQRDFDFERTIKYLKGMIENINITYLDNNIYIYRDK